MVVTKHKTLHTSPDDDNSNHPALLWLNFPQDFHATALYYYASKQLDILYHIQRALADSHSFFFQFGHSAAFVRSIFKPGTVKKPIELCVDSAPPTECGNVGCSFDPKNLIELLTTFCNLEMYSQTRQVVNRQALKYQDLMNALYTADGNIYITQSSVLFTNCACS